MFSANARAIRFFFQRMVRQTLQHDQRRGVRTKGRGGNGAEEGIKRGAEEGIKRGAEEGIKSGAIKNS